MISRRDLVSALRVLHETDVITKIVTRAKRIDVHFMSGGHDGLLVLPNPPNTNDTNTNRNKTKPTTPVVEYPGGPFTKDPNSTINH